MCPADAGPAEAGPSAHSHAAEARAILRLGWPIMLTRLAQFAPNALMLAVVSRLPDGGGCLAGAGMGTMFCNVMGTAFISGSGFGGSALMAQAFGASNPERVGVLLLRQLAMHGLLVVALITPTWLAAEPLLRDALGQPAQTAHLAARFALFRLIALPASTLVQDLSAFLIAQGASRLPAAVTVLASVAQAGLFLLLVRPEGSGGLAMGFDGAALAMSLAEVVQAAILLAATPRALAAAGGAHVRTWPRLGRASFREACRGWLEMLRLGVPAAVMTMAEWLGWESALFQAGRLCPPAASACAPLQVFPALSQTMVLLFMSHFGFSVAAGARVANALGAGRPADARATAATALFLVGSIGLAAAAALFVWRREWAAIFVDPRSPDGDAVSSSIADTLPLVSIYIFLDSLGPSWAHQLLFAAATLRFGALHNVFSFWAVAQPLGALLAFGCGLGVYGLWVGLDAGMALLVAGLGGFIFCALDWDQAARVAAERSGVGPLAAEAAAGRLGEAAAGGLGCDTPAEPLSRKAESAGTALLALAAPDTAFEDGSERA